MGIGMSEGKGNCSRDVMFERRINKIIRNKRTLGCDQEGKRD